MAGGVTAAGIEIAAEYVIVGHTRNRHWFNGSLSDKLVGQFLQSVIKEIPFVAKLGRQQYQQRHFLWFSACDRGYTDFRIVGPYVLQYTRGTLEAAVTADLQQLIFY